MASLVWDLQHQKLLLQLQRTESISFPLGPGMKLYEGIPFINKVPRIGTNPSEMEVSISASFSELCTKSLVLNV